MKTHVIARDNHPKVPGVIDFFIDFSSGEMTGEGARIMESRFRVSPPDGMAHFAWQQSYPAPDPLHNPASMAMVLQSWGYIDIEGDLSQYPLPQADELPEGCVA